MSLKSELRRRLEEKLEEFGIDDADEIADSVVEQLDEDGEFGVDEDLDEDD